MRWLVCLFLASLPATASAQSGVPVDEEEHPSAPGTEGDTGLPPPDPPPPYLLSPGVLEASDDDEEEADEEELDPDDAIIAPSPRRGPSEEELEAEEEAERAAEEPAEDPEPIDEDMELVGDPVDLPEWRLRAGAGVALPTAGDFGFALRLTQDFEWQPRGVEPFLFGIGGSENLGSGLIGQAHARVGLHAWFCDARPVRCQGAVAVIAGAAFGLGNVGPDIAGEVDLRFLFWDALELHVRGGFFTLGGVALVDITGGAGVAF